MNRQFHSAPPLLGPTFHRWGDILLLVLSSLLVVELADSVLQRISGKVLAFFDAPMDQIAWLVRTPRVAKLILRRVLQDWNRLHGEIDFDDLLFGNVLRYCAPEAFDFLIENFRIIRGLSASRDDRETRKKALDEKWNGRMAGVEWQQTAAKNIACFLFPIWSERTIGARQTVPQGVCVSEPTDYWLRFLTADIVSDELSDQEVIRAVQSWETLEDGKHFREQTLAEALRYNAEFASKFEHFSPHFLNGSEFRRIASRLFALLREEGVAADTERVPGFVPLWRLSIRSPIVGAEHQSWIAGEIKRTFQVSLRLANSLYYYYRTNERTEIQRHDCRELRAELISHFREKFESRPDRLVSVLTPGDLHSLYHFAVFFSESREGGGGFHPDEWQWFVRLMMEAVTIDPDLVIPQLLPFVVKEESTIESFVYSLNADFVAALFGEDLPSVLEKLTSEISLEEFSERRREFVISAQDVARRALSEGGLHSS